MIGPKERRSEGAYFPVAPTNHFNDLARNG